MLSTIDKMAPRDRMAARPLRIHLEINDFCNLKCPHCPRENPDIPKNTGHIPLEAVERLRPWFRTANYVGLAGNGEPFLHPDIFRILEVITSEGATPSVISNATLWKKRDLIEPLARLNRPMLLMVSIDGGTKGTFEKWRKNAIFEEVRENLRLLREAKERHGTPFPIVNFISCLMKDTIGEVTEIVDIAREAGASVVGFQNMYPYNKLMDDARVRDMDECRRAISRARKHAAPHHIRIDWLPMSVDVDERGKEGGSYGQLTSEDVDSNMGRVTQASNGEAVRYHCDNIMQQIHVTVEGAIKFCCFWTEGAIGNLTKDDFGDLWNGPEWVQLRKDLHEGRKPGPCQNCHNLVVFDRGRIARSGSREMKDLWGK